VLLSFQVLVVVSVLGLKVVVPVFVLGLRVVVVVSWPLGDGAVAALSLGAGDLVLWLCLETVAELVAIATLSSGL